MSRPHKIGRKRTAAAASIGEVGYTFRKKFDAGWYTGRVVEIRPGAARGKDRRCKYEDGDIEDMSLDDLHALAKQVDNDSTGGDKELVTSANNNNRTKRSSKRDRRPIRTLDEVWIAEQQFGLQTGSARRGGSNGKEGGKKLAVEKKATTASMKSESLATTSDTCLRKDDNEIKAKLAALEVAVQENSFSGETKTTAEAGSKKREFGAMSSSRSQEDVSKEISHGHTLNAVAECIDHSGDKSQPANLEGQKPPAFSRGGIVERESGIEKSAQYEIVDDDMIVGETINGTREKLPPARGDDGVQVKTDGTFVIERETEGSESNETSPTSQQTKKDEIDPAKVKESANASCESTSPAFIRRTGRQLPITKDNADEHQAQEVAHKPVEDEKLKTQEPSSKKVYDSNSDDARKSKKIRAAELAEKDTANKKQKTSNPTAKPQKKAKSTGKTPGLGYWTVEERYGFCKGIIMCGIGKWKRIRKYVPSRTCSQMSTHSQVLKTSYFDEWNELKTIAEDRTMPLGKKMEWLNSCEEFKHIANKSGVMDTTEETKASSSAAYLHVKDDNSKKAADNPTNDLLAESESLTGVSLPSDLLNARLAQNAAFAQNAANLNNLYEGSTSGMFGGLADPSLLGLGGGFGGVPPSLLMGGGLGGLPAAPSLLGLSGDALLGMHNHEGDDDLLNNMTLAEIELSVQNCLGTIAQQQYLLARLEHVRRIKVMSALMENGQSG